MNRKDKERGMKNFERYAEEIQKIGLDNISVTNDGKMIECTSNLDCNNCIFDDTDCCGAKREITYWLYRECEPPMKYINLETQQTEENIIFEANKALAINNNLITNCGSQMVDMLANEEENHAWWSYYSFYFRYKNYVNDYIEWLEHKYQRQINFDIENIKE